MSASALTPCASHHVHDQFHCSRKAGSPSASSREHGDGVERKAVSRGTGPLSAVRLFRPFVIEPQRGKSADDAFMEEQQEREGGTARAGPLHGGYRQQILVGGGEPLARKVRRAVGPSSDRWPTGVEEDDGVLKRACCRRVSFDDGELGARIAVEGSSTSSVTSTRPRRRSAPSRPEGSRVRVSEEFAATGVWEDGRFAPRVASTTTPACAQQAPAVPSGVAHRTASSPQCGNTGGAGLTKTLSTPPQPGPGQAATVERKRKWANVEGALREAERWVEEDYGMSMPLLPCMTYSGRVARLEEALALRPAHGLQIDRRIARIRWELQPTGQGGRPGEEGPREPLSW